MKTVVVVSGKGGTGKTSVAASFFILASNAVAVDCDVDAANMGLLLDPAIIDRHDFHGQKRAEIDRSLCTECGRCVELCRFDAIHGFAVDPHACEGCMVCLWQCPHNAIRSARCLTGEWYTSTTQWGTLVHARLIPGEGNSGRLVSCIKQAAADLGGTEYMIVDGPPGIGCPTIAALSGASLAVVVSEPSVSAIHDLNRALTLILALGIPATVCLNKWDLDTTLADKLAAQAERAGASICGRISYDPAVVEAQMKGMPPVLCPGSEAGSDITRCWNAVKALV